MALTEKIVNKFTGVLESLNTKVEYTNTLLGSSNDIQTEQLGVLQQMLALQQSHLDFLKDVESDRERQADLNPVDEPDNTVSSDSDDVTVTPSVPEMSGFDLLKGLALAPFAFRFAKGFVSSITDGLVELTASGTAGLLAALKQPFNSLMVTMGRAFAWVDSLADSAKIIPRIFGTFGRTLGAVGLFIGRLFSKIPGVGAFKFLLSRLMWPITIVLGVVQAVRDFINTEGTVFEKFEAGVGGFLGEIIGAPLNLLGDVVGWILTKFGFEETGEAVSGFDFVQLMKDMVGSLFDAVSGAISIVTDLFSWGEEDKTALGVLGKITDIIYAPINMAINFIRGMFGWSDPNEPFKLQDWIVEKFLQAVDWIKGIFSWGTGLVVQGWTNLTTFVSDQWTKVKDWIYDLFDWGAGVIVDGWTNLTTFVSDQWTKVKDWIVGLFDWGAGVAVEGWTNLTTFVSGVWTKVKDWFTGLFSWGEDIAAEGWTDLTSFVSGVWTSVKEWFTGLFSWGGDIATEGWTNLTNFASDTWKSVKEWITGLFTWNEPTGEEDEKGFLRQIFDDTIESIKNFFTQVFDFIPSFEEIKSVLTSMLPKWMRPEAVEEQRARIEADIAEQQGYIADGDMRNWRGKHRETIIQELQEELAGLPQLSYGGVVQAPESGALAMLHGTEAVIPLDSPKAAAKINAIAEGSANMARAMINQIAPIVNSGGNVSNSNNSTNTTVINKVSDPYRSLDPAIPA